MRQFLGDGLLSSEGEFHRSQRLVIQPAFHRQQFARQETVIREQGSRICESWHDRQQMNIMSEMKRLTLAISTQMLFSTNTETEADEINDAVKAIVSRFTPFGSPLGGLLAKLPRSRLRRVREAQAKLDRIVCRIIAERRQSGAAHDDLLSMLIALLDQTDADPHTNAVRIRDETLTFFLAGYETTGTALAWTLYLLAQHPAVRSELHDELNTVLGSRPPSLADLSRLRYTKMVFAEAMRVYPPVWALPRYLTKDFKVGGYVMPAGSVVIISQYLMHHDPRYFADPARFDPQRWTPEAKAARPEYSYFPFGGGPRGCMGEGLAWTQGILLIAAIAQHWQMELVPSRPMELQPRITLLPRHDIMLRLERRGEQTPQSSGATAHL